MNALKAKWETLSKREKILILAGVVVIACLLAYELIISPFNAFLNNKKQLIIQHQVSLVTIQQLDQQIKALSQSSATKSAPTLQTLQNMIQAQGLSNSISGLQQINGKQFALQVSALQFDNLIQFLITIARQYNLQVTEIHLQADNKSGAVNGSVILQ